jgi:hypothetical protein
MAPSNNAWLRNCATLTQGLSTAIMQVLQTLHIAFQYAKQSVQQAAAAHQRTAKTKS